MKNYFIINPIAGKGKRFDKTVKEIEALTDKEDIEIFYTEYIGHAREIAKNLAANPFPKRIFACGGDGTLNEVVNGIYNSENTTLGIVPIGSGNDFIKNFTNLDDFFDIKKQINGKEAVVDLIKHGDALSINMLNIGFDSDVCSRMNRMRNNPLAKGHFGYILSLIITLIKPLGKQFSMVIDDKEKLSGNYLLASVSNGTFCGGGFRTAPYAVLDDGLMDLCIVEKVSRIKFLRLVKSYSDGTYIEKQSKTGIVKFRKIKKLKLIPHCDMEYCADGEPNKLRETEISILPKAISIIIPGGCDFAKKLEEKSLPADSAL